uniref:glycerol-3-phosphate acyltransferase n=1 Tax=Okeania sp. SIO2F4 TaxID=2607790 RepID=UPI0025DB57DD|nr:glycerol-3-phosphate acyltransferase [Okeania sp. SIO2F4]
MQILIPALFLTVCFCLGALPLTNLIVKNLANIDLTKVGTGNISVAAAFVHAPKPVAIVAVLAEISRGIAPILAAKLLFPEIPTWQLLGLIFLVAGRYFIAQGGGVTNASWAILVYSPVVALASGITGFLILVIGKQIFLRKNKNIRQWSARLGCLSSFFWVLLFRQEPSFSELLAMAGLVIFLVVINFRQSDDMALHKQPIFSLDGQLDPKICGEKAARLALLKKAGFNVPDGFVLPAIENGNRELVIGSEVKKSISDSRLSAAFFSVDKILDKLNEMSWSFPLIVRSSAVGEDSDNSSAAGQYETIFPVRNETELLEAINICRQSYWLPDAVAYRRQREIPDAEMAVLIQPYIMSQFAGVMFTRNPLDGGGKIIIEALRGGAEKVVGGQFTPVHLEVDKNRFQEGKNSTGKGKGDDSVDESFGLESQNILPPEITQELVNEGEAKVKGKSDDSVEKSFGLESQEILPPEIIQEYFGLENQEILPPEIIQEGEAKVKGKGDGSVEKSFGLESQNILPPEITQELVNEGEAKVKGKSDDSVEKSFGLESQEILPPEITQESVNEGEAKVKGKSDESFGLESQEILPPEITQELVNQAEAIEGFFHGLPQDIEWCWDGEKIWILQSRPITNLRPIWTRTIAAEVIPGAIHPLTWSINRPLTCGVWGEIFTIVLREKVAKLDFTKTATLLGSHAYFNATLLGEIFRMMGLPEQGLEFLLRGQKMGKPPLGKVWSALPGLWRLIQKEMAVDREFERDYHQIFVPALESLENNFKQNSSQSLSELLVQVERIQEWLKPITYYNILGPIGLAIRRSLFRVSEEWLPTDTAPEIVSIRELQKLAVKLKMATKSDVKIEAEFQQNQELQREFQQWLESYGYLSEVGTDIAVATWGEKPDNFRELLLAMARKGEISKLSVNTVKYLNLWQRWRLGQCAKRARTKGKIAEVYGKLLAYLRLTFLAMEIKIKSQKPKVKSDERQENLEVFQEKGDIFYLEFDEIRQWILSIVGKVEEGNLTKEFPLIPLGKGEMFSDRLLAQEGTTEPPVGWVEERNPTDSVGVEEQNRRKFNAVSPHTSPSSPPSPHTLRQLIRQRQEQLEKDGDRQVPQVVYGNVLPQESQEIISTEENVSILQGIPGSVGCVEGYVKVCGNLEVNLPMEENLIIVVPYTDAGWAPLLLKAKGIIAEVGGQLSHGAIIAREYGIPAVMNVSGAMTRLQDGQKVRVDGYRGTVEFI